MNLIEKITDKNIGEEERKIDNPRTRTAVRTILLNDEGKIALLHKKNNREYKLIGGGVDKGETFIEALKREVLEEAGCEIKIISELGYIEEYRTRDNFTQTSYSYITRVTNDTKQLHLTKKEMEEGAELCWYEPNLALQKIVESYNNILPSKYSDLYNTKFIIKRDERILQYYISNKK